MAVALLAVALGLPRIGWAAESDPREMLEEGMQTIFGALEMLMMSIPQYSAPEVLPNGDIIIRRKQPMPKSAPAEEENKKPDNDTRT
ncbi:hypothetical protein JCM17960_24200 [Magnetospira thiophila]